MKSKTITVNGVQVTCYEDGSVENANPKTGEILRRFGSKDGKGYPKMRIRGKDCLAHRLIAQAFYGDILSGMEVDHINGDRSDNRPENLRVVTRSQNLRAHCNKRPNASSQYRGVSWVKREQKWASSIFYNGVSKRLGLFTDEKAAAIAYNDAAAEAGFSPEALNTIDP